MAGRLQQQASPAQRAMVCDERRIVEPKEDASQHRCAVAAQPSVRRHPAHEGRHYPLRPEPRPEHGALALWIWGATRLGLLMMLALSRSLISFAKLNPVPLMATLARTLLVHGRRAAILYCASSRQKYFPNQQRKCNVADYMLESASQLEEV